MKSIAFPKMFNSSSTNIISDREATENNLKLLLLSEQNELLGDPYFGTGLKKYIYEQNNPVLRDMLVDNIYTAIALFMPQLVVKRKDISLKHYRNKLYCEIRATNQLNFQTDMYNIVLLQNEEDRSA